MRLTAIVRCHAKAWMLGAWRRCVLRSGHRSRHEAAATWGERPIKAAYRKYNDPTWGPVTVRLANCLQDVEIDTIEKLRAHFGGSHSPRPIRNMGRITIREARELLKRLEPTP